ncbi:MAG: spore photoproduct lyase family protein [Pseudomonadota bacterium]
MIETVYVEAAVRDHPRTREVLARLPRASVHTIERYGELFNRKRQNFRLQKQQPALILARKHDNWVLPAPPDYSIGGEHNYYFSHLLNCVYDCRYCFLQGMFRSANYVLFVNYEDFFDAIGTRQDALSAPGWYFSGYDCDSLALDPWSGFADAVLDWFGVRPECNLELRTKSTQIRPLLRRSAHANIVVAFSLAPDPVARALEHKAPPLQKRLSAIATLAEAGWQIGLRFDPVVWSDDYRALYRDFFDRVFDCVPIEAVHSVSLGGFRLPVDFMKTVTRLYPDEPFFAGPMSRRDGMVSIAEDREQALLGWCQARILERVPAPVFFPCQPIDGGAD